MIKYFGDISTPCCDSKPCQIENLVVQISTSIVPTSKVYSSAVENWKIWDNLTIFSFDMSWTHVKIDVIELAKLNILTIKLPYNIFCISYRNQFTSLRCMRIFIFYVFQYQRKCTFHSFSWISHAPITLIRIIYVHIVRNMMIWSAAKFELGLHHS